MPEITGGIYVWGLVHVDVEIADSIIWNNVADGLGTTGEGGDFSVADISLALTHPHGPLGALPTADCSSTPVEPTTWGHLKTLYR